MDQGDTEDPLRNLGNRVESAKRAARRPGAAPSQGAGDAAVNRNALAVGLRIGLELVVAVFVGAGLGWAFDNWLGTGPWGLIVFLLLGFGAGVANVFRMALGMERAVGYAPPKRGVAKQVDWSDDED
jgi:ATP synthase protein I